MAAASDAAAAAGAELRADALYNLRRRHPGRQHCVAPLPHDLRTRRAICAHDARSDGTAQVPLLLSHPVYILWDDRAIPVCLLAWAFARCYPWAVRSFSCKPLHFS
jgi:hypothetical protein